MRKVKNTSYFWTTYSDFMSSLFFVMLVLFVLSIVLVFAKTKEIRGLIDTLTEKNKELVEQQKIIEEQNKELEEL